MSHEGLGTSTRKRQIESTERYLAFSLRTEQYAIPLLQVKEVIGMTETTPVPKTPNYFKGIINLRGQVISVVDLRTKLMLSKAEDGPETSIIILDLAPLCLGVIVDSINSVLALGPDELSDAPDGTNVRDQYLTAVARKENRLTLILDIEATLTTQDLDALKKQKTNNAA